MENILANLDTYALYLVAVVGSLTLIVRGLSEIAKLTKTEKDDHVLAMVSRILSGLANILDKITPASKPKDAE